MTSIPSKISEFEIVPIEEFSQEKAVWGYYVNSTAPINAEDLVEKVNQKENPLTQQRLREIADYLVNSKNPQIVISVHGYGTRRSEAQKRYRKIYKYVTEDCKPEKPKETVFIGYRWPAENPTQDDPQPPSNKPTTIGDKLNYAFQSLPTLLTIVLSFGLILGVITAFLIIARPFLLGHTTAQFITLALVAIVSFFGTKAVLKKTDLQDLLPRLPIYILLGGLLIGGLGIFLPLQLNGLVNGLFVILLILFILSVGIILALLALRLSTYLRDRNRAMNYGVVDLVELIRQIDQAVIERRQSENIRIKLNFLGHSMGCFVVTNVVRILSDVFDTESINKQPSNYIGRVFSLGRLILVAPDISIDSIMPVRSNFLRSALRRCEEAYLFSNEGDLALRLASTAVNYINFPARTRFRGYRLGNLTVQRFADQYDYRNQRLTEKDYGIVNNKNGQIESPYCCLEIRASNREHQQLDELVPVGQVDKEIVKGSDVSTIDLQNVRVADRFTYFDCTDYCDFTDSEPNKPTGVVSQSLKKSALVVFDYVRLSIAYFVKGEINTHGGFFYGKLSQQLMYELAFLGFQGLLDNLKPGKKRDEQIQELSQQCCEKYIQVVIAPERVS